MLSNPNLNGMTRRSGFQIESFSSPWQSNSVKQHAHSLQLVLVSESKSFVSKQKRANKLNFLPNIETVLNNSMWEQWDVFLEDSGVEEQEWNNDQI